MVRMPQYILIFCNVAKLVLTAETKVVPFETPCQKDVWWKSEQTGQLHAPAIVLLGTLRYVT
jgi:hypothetical protein